MIDIGIVLLIKSVNPNHSLWSE